MKTSKEGISPVNSRLHSLEKSITESKQAVVKHIAKARILERERNHLASIKKALMSIGKPTQDSPTSYILMIRGYDFNEDEDIAVRLQKLRTILRLEEIDEKNIVFASIMSTATRWLQPSFFGIPDKSSELTIAMKMHESLSSYDDSSFAAYLAQAPLPVSAVVDDGSRCKLISFFQRIVVSASKGFCSSTDAAALFSTVESSLLPTNSAEKLWTILCLRLRRIIFQIHLGTVVAPCLTIITTNSPKKLSASPESHNNKLKSNKKARIGDKGKAENFGNKKLADREQLVKALEESQNKQAVISGQIAADLTHLCPDLSTLPKPGRSGQLFARSWALRILEKHYSHINVLALQKSFGRWLAVCRRYTTDRLVQAFLRALGAKRLVQLIQFRSTRRKVRGMDMWIAHVQQQTFFEQTAAAAEIQKVVRGFLGRIKARARARAGARAKVRVKDDLHSEKLEALTLLETETEPRDSVHMRTPQTDESKKSRFSSQRSPLFKFNSATWEKDVAAAHIQRIIRGFLGRVRAAKRKERRRTRVAERAKRAQFLNARKESAVRTIQRFWRGKVGRKRVRFLRFEKARQLRHRRRALAATTLQRVLRGGWGRTRVKALRRARAIACMQRGWRCALARRELSRRQNRHRIQVTLAQQAALEKAVKDAAERKAVAERAAAQEASEKAAKEAAEKEASERAAAAAKAEAEKIAAAIAKAEAEKEAAERAAKEAAEKEAAMKALADREAAERAAKEAAERDAAERAAKEVADVLESASPLRYYDLRSRYLQSQNEHFRTQAVQIQRVARGLLGRKFVRNMRRVRAAKVIQHQIRLFLLRARARKEVSRRRALKVRREVAAVTLQRMGRGLIVRTGWRRQIRGDILRWFIRKVRSTIRIALALQTLRMRKRQYLRRVRAATVIQSLARGVRGRKWMKKNRRRLTRERAARLKERRLRACIRIQCFFRKVLARRAVGRRRAAKEAEIKEQREWEELERSLDGLHGEFLLELMAIRMETGARGMVARKLLFKRIEAAKLEKLKQIERNRNKAAATIQALARGVAARVRHKKNLPALKKAKLARQYCVECEVQVGMRRCRQCKDKFCVTCYENVHAKGTRRTHTFENVKIPANLAAALQAERERLLGGAGANKSSTISASAAKRGKAKKQDWEEFYDSSAKAKYWFNKVTGEASWISPF